jgi:hypothetical protein
MFHSRIAGGCLVISLAICSTAGNCFAPYFYNSSVKIQTWNFEHDLLLGDHLTRDPYRGYFGGRTTAIEKYGYTTVNGTTNGNAEDFRSNLSVPNDWVMYNQNGVCGSMVTYNKRLVNYGIADLKCNIDTGYNQSQYVAQYLDADTSDANGNYVPQPTDRGTNFLWPDEQLSQGEALRAGGEMYQLTLLTDGNLMQTYDGMQAVWETGTSSGAHLLMQLDGNLVLYDGGWNPVWASNTAGNPGAYLNVQDDGNLVVYSASDQPLWSRW